MKRLLLAAIVLIGLTGCLPYTEGNPTPTSTDNLVVPPPVPSGVDVPQNMTPVRFEVRIYDEDGDEVFDAFDAELKLTAVLTPDSPEDAVRYADIIDAQTGMPVESPHSWTSLLPFDNVQYVETGEVATVALEATVTLGPYWHVTCLVSVNGVVVHGSTATNEGALPGEAIIVCIWP